MPNFVCILLSYAGIKEQLDAFFDKGRLGYKRSAMRLVRYVEGKSQEWNVWCS